MRQGFFKQEHTNTAFVVLDTRNCEACWKCLDVCTNDVIGRINLLWHKHVRFINGSACTGCMKCVKICATGAISKRSKEKEVLLLGKNINRFIIYLGLFIFGIATVFSGMLIQVKYHMGNHGNIAINDYVFGINYQGWSAIHKISIVALIVFMIYHVYQHWKWYKVVITKKLIAKNQQALILSLLFVLVAITGLIPWFIDLLKGDEMLRKVFIEIHDKLAIILSVYFILHIIKRLKWLFTTFEKMIIKHSTQQQLYAMRVSEIHEGF